MIIAALVLLISALLLVLKKVRPFAVLRVKRLFIPALCVVFVLCLLIFSSTAVKAAVKGLRLWLDIVFPSLFPFFVASELMNRTGLMRAAGRFFEPLMRPLFNIPGCASFAFFMGITSGYPVGAKITADLRRQELVSKEEADRLIAFSNNSGPLFIAGSVATGMLQIPSAGLYLLGCHIAACVTVGVIKKFGGRRGAIKPLRCTGRPISCPEVPGRPSGSAGQNRYQNFGLAFGEAVCNSILLALSIGGYIILFSVIINLLIDTGFITSLSAVASRFMQPLAVNAFVSPVICGIFEITTGCYMASTVSGAPLELKLTALSLIIGWSGLSVHSQVIGIIGDTDISVSSYITGKLLQGFIAAAYTLAGIKIAGIAFWETEPAFRPFMYFHGASSYWGFPHSFYAAVLMLAAALTLLLAFAAILFVASSLARRSS